jgi:hypothetical protein
MNREADDAITIIARRQRHTHRRLSDKILIAFHQACDQADFEVAEQLLSILDTMASAMRLPRAQRGTERRRVQANVVAAHERLWLLRHPNVGRDR